MSLRAAFLAAESSAWWCAAIATLTLLQAGHARLSSGFVAVTEHQDINKTADGMSSRRASAASSEYETKYVTHLMPWYDRVSYLGVQGNHWCDPNFGNSYYESVFGRYASGDPAIIRKQLLLMKTAGLDGVWIDLQFPEWLSSIRAIVNEVVDLRMNFAVVIDNYARADIVEDVKDDLQEFMAMPNYYRVFGRPILPYYEHPVRWGATKMPSWRTLDGHRPFIIGTYSEHPDGPLPEGYDSLFFWNTPNMGWLDAYYSSTALSVKVGAVFRGWREAYADRKHTPPYMGFLQETLQLVQEYRPYFAQLVTWNDYTEGTMLEPAWLANVSSPNACADPRKSLWHDESKTCAQVLGEPVFDNGGAMPPCTASAYEVAADAQESVMCSGSGEQPCADVLDCSKPVGGAFGASPSGCPEGNRSAYDDLAVVAREVAGLSVANATATFEAIVAGWEPEPEPEKQIATAAASRLGLPLNHARAVFLATFALAFMLLHS